MTEKYIMSENSIPDGMLHDQDLYEISLNNGILTLSFNVFLSKEEYGGSDFAERYFEYKKCHIRCVLDDLPFCEARLETTRNRKGRGKIQYLPIFEFVEIADKEIKRRKKKGYWAWEYLGTSVGPNCSCASIELFIWLKYKRVVYSSCKLVLETKEIEFIWE